MIEELSRKAHDLIRELCSSPSGRPVGSERNRKATRQVRARLVSLGYAVETPQFPCIHWTGGPSRIETMRESLPLLPGPFSPACDVTAELGAAATLDELIRTDCEGQVLLLRGDLVKEQLMPKGFIFYNPDEHRAIYRALEASGAAAVIAATGRNPQLAGGAYPFPFIEDGDFPLPSAYLKDVAGDRLAAIAGERVQLRIDSRREVSRGYNVIAGKGPASGRIILLCAHIDTKEGTPGALDNATGIAILLLAAELLAAYDGPHRLELAALNGEDYYSIPGQMQYLERIRGREGDILLAINCDGAGFHEGSTAYSLYNCPETTAGALRSAFSRQAGMAEGPQWLQSDHGMFAMMGIPAAAVTSAGFKENLSASITHTPDDRPEITDPARCARIALAISDFVYRLDDARP